MFDWTAFFGTAFGMLMLFIPVVMIATIAVWVENKFDIPASGVCILLVILGFAIAGGLGVIG